MSSPPAAIPSTPLPEASGKARGWAEIAVLALSAILSLPAFFFRVPAPGLDPSWMMLIQDAKLKGAVFGRDFIFTYGPLGLLFTRSPYSRPEQVAFDAFLVGNIVYMLWFAVRGRAGGRWLALCLIPGVAIVTKFAIVQNPAGVAFALLCFWLWRCVSEESWVAMAASIVWALLLTFGKVNYALVVGVAVPLGAVAMARRRGRGRTRAAALVGGWAAATVALAFAWHVDLPGYVRSAIELTAGYNEAMGVPAEWMLGGRAVPMALAALAGVAAVGAWELWRRRSRACVAIVALTVAGCFMLYKNAFVRGDHHHVATFHLCLPLALAAWWAASGRSRAVTVLLALSLVMPLRFLSRGLVMVDDARRSDATCARYVRELLTAPARPTMGDLAAALTASHPWMAMPGPAREAIGQATADVMPWDGALAVANGLRLRGRPVPQSYMSYAAWLDQRDSDFLSSAGAPEVMLFARGEFMAMDERPVAWDEAIAKRALLENYRLESEFEMQVEGEQPGSREMQQVFVMRRSPRCRRWSEVRSEAIHFKMGEKVRLPETRGELYLTAEISRTTGGKVRAAIGTPSRLRVTVETADGREATYLAVLPIMRTSVLVSRMTERAAEVRNWLDGHLERNARVISLRFTADHPSDFPPEITAMLTERKLEENFADGRH